MADEKDVSATPTAVSAEPKFVPNGNGTGSLPAEDGAVQSKYAPAKSAGDQGDGDGSDEVKKEPNPVRKAIVVCVIVIVVLFALYKGFEYYKFSQTHVNTDDAYVTGNFVQVSPIISGTLSQLTVEEGDTVKKGQLIARLDDSGQLAMVRQARAAYDAAETQIPQALTNLAYQKQATNAAIEKAQSEVAGQSAKTAGAQQQVQLSNATVKNQVKQAESQVAQASAQAAGVAAQVKTAQAAVQSKRQDVQTAQRAADAAAANIAAAQANADKAARDQTRYAVLVKQQAITQQQYDAVVAAAISAQSQLKSVQDQAAQAKSQIATAQANVQQAIAQLHAAQRQADAARQQVDVARAGLGLAKANLAQVGIQQSNVLNNMQQGSQAQADLAAAQAGKQQITLKQQQIKTYEAQAAQAKAALSNARVTEADTYIYAPANGQVVRKAASVGASLSPGQAIVTMTAGNNVWVTANFKETQLTDVRTGQPVEVEVDTFPGKIFQGKVQAIQEATGASTALLPPDNATGNFTKVVQRVPVRIELIPAADNADKKYARAADIQNLRQGLSVTATIDTSSARQ